MKTLKWIILGLFLLGLMLIGVSFLSGNELTSVYGIFKDDDQYGEQISYIYNEIPDSLVMNMDQRHVIVHLVDQDFIEVKYYKHEDDTWIFTTSVESLSIKQSKPAVWSFFNFRNTSKFLLEVHVYMPTDSVKNLDISNKVGLIDLVFQDFETFTNLKLSTSVGSIRLNNIEVTGIFDIATSTGSIDIQHLKSNDADMVVSTGSIKISDFIINDLNIVTSTGSIDLVNGNMTGRLIAETSTGSIDINNVIATRYRLKASTGSIQAKFASTEMLYYDLMTSTGSIRVLGVNQGKRHLTQSQGLAVIEFKASSSTGSIAINVTS